MDSQEEHSAARHLVSFPHISNAKTKVCFFFFAAAAAAGIYFPTVPNANSGRLHNGPWNPS